MARLASLRFRKLDAIHAFTRKYYMGNLLKGVGDGVLIDKCMKDDDMNFLAFNHNYLKTKVCVGTT